MRPTDSFAGTVTAGEPPRLVASGPFVDNSAWAVAAGELTNRSELRQRLSTRVHRPRSDGDAELISCLYAEYGADCVHHMEGAIAFAVSDGKQVFLARDRIGMCPLYYSVAGQRLSFASTLSGLLSMPGTPAELDRTALADLSVVGRLCGSRTALRGIEALPAGEVLTVDNHRGVVSDRYHRLAVPPREDVDLRTAEDELLDLLGQAVRTAAGEDRAAILLSGGLDSAVLAALLAPEGQRQAFVVAERPDHPDAVQAARIAEHLGYPLERLIVGFSDFLAVIPRYLATVGHPTGLGSVGTRLLCESIGAGTVCVSGEGADDVFGGYGDYLQTMKDRTELSRRADTLAEHGFDLSDEAADLLGRMTANHTFPSYLAAVHIGHDLGPYTQRDAQLTHLTAAATGVHLRLPYLDRRLVEFALALPLGHRVDHHVGTDKRVLRTAVLRAFHDHEVLIDSVLRRKFGGPSAVRGHKERLAAVCDHYLPADYRQRHPLGPLAQRGHELVLLELFEEIVVNRRGTVPTGFSLPEFLRGRSKAASPVPS